MLFRSGQIFFEGEDITNCSRKKLGELRKNMQIIFQDPYSSLDPRMSVREIIEEPLVISKLYPESAKRQARVDELMGLVGLSQRLANSYPHELDGGRRQRIGVARALSLNPKFIVCDEPVSALDVSVQAQILNLMQDLQEQLGLTYIFITHDLSVVKHISNDICVMYLGVLVENCNTKELFKNPMHPYTKALLSAIPVPDLSYKRNREIIMGELTSPVNPKPGCRFAPRCRYAKGDCFETTPTLRDVGENHFVACHHIETINELGNAVQGKK